MALAQAKSGSSNAVHRTNSLAFAKHDCHTCAAFETECDRQRPRCGTCLSNRRKCDGFAMPLIWKDLHVAHTASQSGNTDVDHTRKRGPQENTEFKFIRGRPKKRRKPKTDDFGGLATTHQGCFLAEMVPRGTSLLDSSSTSPDSTQGGANTSCNEVGISHSKFSDLA
jgi:hypothetical protein